MLCTVNAMKILDVKKRKRLIYTKAFKELNALVDT